MAFKLIDLTTHRESKRNDSFVFVRFFFFVLFFPLSLSLSVFSLLIKSYIKRHYSTYGDTEQKH